MENIIYLDEDAVNEELITRHGGQLEETIERVNRDVRLGGEAEGQAGEPTGLFARLKGAISANYERGKEEEFVYDLTDEVAKFALLLEVLDASGATTIDNQFTTEDRSGLASDSPIMITAPLTRIPIGEIKDRVDIGDEVELMSDALDDLAKAGIGDATEIEEAKDSIEDLSYATSGMRKMFKSLSDDDDIYRTNTTSEVDFVMGLTDENFRNPPRDFPSRTKQYALIGKIMTKVEQGDDVPLINFAELAEMNADNPRNQKTAEMKMKGKVADMANDILKRDVNISEFELSYPDVQIRPLAIY